MRTKKDYTTHFKLGNADHGLITVPKGTRLTNMTAMGVDEDYHFVSDLSWVRPHEDGTKQYGLLHDLEYYGINVPKIYVEH